MPKSRIELLNQIRSIRGVKRDFINFLRRRGLRVSYSSSWDGIVDAVLSSRKIKASDLEYFLVRVSKKRVVHEVVEEERVIERRRVRRVSREETSVSYVKGMVLEREFESLVGLLGFVFERWVGGAGGEVGDYVVYDPSGEAKALVSCKNVSKLTVKHVNDLYANAIAFGYNYAVLVISSETKVMEGASERAQYLGIQVIDIDSLRRNLLSRRSIDDKIGYLKSTLFGSKLIKTVTETRRVEKKRFRKAVSPLVMLHGLVVEPLPTSLDIIRSMLVRKHSGIIFRRQVAIHLHKYILYLVPHYIVEYEGRVRVGRSYEGFQGRLVIDASDGSFASLSIEDLVEDIRQLKEPGKVKLKYIVKVVDKLSDRVLNRKIIDYIVDLERRYKIYEEGIFTASEYILTPRELIEKGKADYIDEAIESIEEEHEEGIEAVYAPRKQDIRITSKETVYLPYWCIECEVLPKGVRKEAWAEAYVSKPDINIEPCPWRKKY